MAPSSPEQAVIEEALARGFLTSAALAEAKALQQQLAAQGQATGLLPLLRAQYLPPGCLEELRVVYSQALTDAGEPSSELPAPTAHFSAVLPVHTVAGPEPTSHFPAVLPLPDREDSEQRKSPRRPWVLFGVCLLGVALVGAAVISSSSLSARSLAEDAARTRSEDEAEKLAEQKLAEQKLAEQKLAEQKLTERKLAERKLAERKLAERKLAERRRDAWRREFLPGMERTLVERSARLQEVRAQRTAMVRLEKPVGSNGSRLLRKQGRNKGRFVSTSWPYSLAFSPDGRWLAASALHSRYERERGLTPYLWVWELPSGRLAKRVLLPWASKPQKTTRYQWFHLEGFTSLAFTPNGQSLVAAAFFEGSNGRNRLFATELWAFNTTTWRVQRFRPQLETTPLTRIELSPKGGHALATGTYLRPTSWDLNSHKLVRVLESRGYYATYSPNGDEIAVSGPSEVEIVSAATGKAVRTLGRKRPPWLQYHPKRPMLLFVDTRKVSRRAVSGLFVWSWEKASTSNLWDGPINGLSISFSKGVCLPVAGRTRLLDLQTGAVVGLDQGKAFHGAGAISPGGRWAATNGRFESIKLWDLEFALKTRANRRLRTLLNDLAKLDTLLKQQLPELASIVEQAATMTAPGRLPSAQQLDGIHERWKRLTALQSAAVEALLKKSDQGVDVEDAIRISGDDPRAGGPLSTMKRDGLSALGTVLPIAKRVAPSLLRHLLKDYPNRHPPSVAPTPIGREVSGVVWLQKRGGLQRLDRGKVAVFAGPMHTDRVAEFVTGSGGAFQVRIPVSVTGDGTFEFRHRGSYASSWRGKARLGAETKSIRLVLEPR